MDVLAGLLDGPRARGAFLLRSVLDPPWALRVQDRAPLTLVALVRGWAWILPERDEAVRLDAGDVAVVRGPDPYTIADDPATAPTVVIHPGQLCTSASDGRSLREEWDLGVRTWGTGRDGATTMLTGTYERAGEISRSLLAALPPVLAMRRADWDSPLVTLLAHEIVTDTVGQRAVLDRLLDALLIAVLRTWLAGQEESAPGWYRAQRDPAVRKALQLVHSAPEHPWTVAGLATECGVSRTVLARRFTELVGQPPMSYLTSWRLTLAADLLCRPGSTVAGVARRVGYGTAFALSAAFKRERGISPREYRALADRSS
ncbi:AraC family transcriptional regulator [Haloechinothrix sp. YIM 98757]|uniref:AraC family transcriptional regulator n=1 Tax=Haloechinothrix aidingensis TaxID=2752311 RepID=A0A837ZU07_9PSEU|nr:AraC family transcriptional regulator [Haloechinothrix aidingensis]MBA0124066.1 AraC family transcriptional regulator [Haloechinothrix aidingensis]